MRIAIIGAGNVGGGLAAAAVRAEHDVVISASSSDSAGKAASSTGATAASSNGEAVAGRRPRRPRRSARCGRRHRRGARRRARGQGRGRRTNPLNATYTDLTTTGTSAAETLQQQLPGCGGRQGVQHRLRRTLGSPTEGGEPLDVLIAGDDAAAKATVGALAGSLGFTSIDAGGLRMARTLEEIAFLNISLNAGNGWAWQSALEAGRPDRGRPMSTVNPVRLNHAVLFVADLDRSVRFYTEVFGMEVAAREPRANAAFLRLPRSGNHHDLGPVRRRHRRRPEAARRHRPVPPRLAARHHRRARRRPATLLATPAPTPASPAMAPPRASTAPTPTATSSRSCGCCPARTWGAVRERRADRPPRPRREVSRWSGVGTAGRVLPGSVDAAVAAG